MEYDLFLALFYEHQERTHHDFNRSSNTMGCNICLHLRAFDREYHKAIKAKQALDAEKLGEGKL